MNPVLDFKECKGCSKLFISPNPTIARYCLVGGIQHDVTDQCPSCVEYLRRLAGEIELLHRTRPGEDD